MNDAYRQIMVASQAGGQIHLTEAHFFMIMFIVGTFIIAMLLCAYAIRYVLGYLIYRLTNKKDSDEHADR